MPLTQFPHLPELQQTDPELAGVLRQLADREPIFHRPEQGSTRADFEAMTAPDFWEVGASGRIYGRQFVLNELERRRAAPYEDVWETSDLRCRRLSANVYLLTYTLLQYRSRLTRRSTLWERHGDSWRILYHQGTVVADE